MYDGYRDDHTVPSGYKFKVNSGTKNQLYHSKGKPFPDRMAKVKFKIKGVCIVLFKMIYYVIVIWKQFKM